MATSGTVQTSLWTQRQFIEHAARRALIRPEQLGAEALQVAQELLFSQLSEYCAAGFPLWTRTFNLLNTPIGGTSVQTPNGTVDVLTVFWRIFMPYRGPAVDGGGNDVSALFSGQPGTDVTILGPNPSVIVNFGSPLEVDTVGVILGGSTPLTTALQVLTSTDGVNYSLASTIPSATYTPGQWTYFDLDPSVQAQYVKLTYSFTGDWTINQILFGMANWTDIQIGPLNIDDYYNLPDKLMKADRVNSAYIDRLYPNPIIRAWPTLTTDGFYAGTVSALMRRYIQDPGQPFNQLEVPSRWNEGVTSRLGHRMMMEIDESMLKGDQQPMSYLRQQQRQQRMQQLDQIATKAEMIMWAEERTRGPIRLTPNISSYTA